MKYSLRWRIGKLRWWLKDTLFRAYAAIVGYNLAEWRRLIEAGRLTVGPHTYERPIVRCFGTDDKLIIGGYSSLCLSAMVLVGGDHGSDRVTTYAQRFRWNMEGAEGFTITTGDTCIGSDVWLCERATVLSGVRVGDGAVIGACAVVTKDVPPYAIVGGNPARVIRYRHTPEQIEALLQIKWWDWPDADVVDAVPLLEGTDADAFIDWARTNKSHLISSVGAQTTADKAT